MTSVSAYPTIMKPGELKRLNDVVFAKIKTPIFFATPEPSRPCANDEKGKLYEIVTGLYVIYKDYGMRILETYLAFCLKKVESGATYVTPHYNSVKNLRGGLCHGCLPEGANATKILNALDYYIHAGSLNWPTTVGNLDSNQCKKVVEIMSKYSNKLIDYIERCAEKISKSNELQKQWRDELIKKALDGNTLLYGQGNCYFDERIVIDLELKQRGGAVKKPYQQVVKDWLLELEPKVRNGNLTDADEMRRMLIQKLYDLYNPSLTNVSSSSADLLLGDLV